MFLRREFLVGSAAAVTAFSANPALASGPLTVVTTTAMIADAVLSLIHI